MLITGRGAIGVGANHVSQVGGSGSRCNRRGSDLGRGGRLFGSEKPVGHNRNDDDGYRSPNQPQTLSAPVFLVALADLL